MDVTPTSYAVLIKTHMFRYLGVMALRKRELVFFSQVFRVYYFVKLKNGVYFIQEMRFEKQK